MRMRIVTDGERYKVQLNTYGMWRDMQTDTNDNTFARYEQAAQFIEGTIIESKDDASKWYSITEYSNE